MTSQPGQQTITIHIFPNISRSKGNQAVKFGQVIEDKKRNIFFVKPGKLVSDLFLFLKRLYMR